MSFFITGTDTEVGKTYFTSNLIRALREEGHDAVGFKPIACGDRDDAATLAEASGLNSAHDSPDLDRLNPIFYPPPVAPFAAAQLTNRPVRLDAVHAAYQSLASKYEIVLVEGIGGWEVPLSESDTLADLALALHLPVLVVVANRLGALNHTLLTAHAIHAKGLTLAGIVLNHLEDTRDTASISNPEILRQTLPNIPILAEILHEDPTIDPAPFLNHPPT
ncbi:MAG: dethiobiotin synthase [Verrucomicrobiota bacterium]